MSPRPHLVGHKRYKLEPRCSDWALMLSIRNEAVPGQPQATIADVSSTYRSKSLNQLDSLSGSPEDSTSLSKVWKSSQKSQEDNNNKTDMAVASGQQLQQPSVQQQNNQADLAAASRQQLQQLGQLANNEPDVVAASRQQLQQLLPLPAPLMANGTLSAASTAEVAGAATSASFSYRDANLNATALRNQRRRKQEEFMALTFAGIVILFVICHLPRMLLDLHELATHEMSKRCGPPFWIMPCIHFSHIMLVFHGSTKLLIYCLISSEFRKEFRCFVKECVCRVSR